MPQIILRCKNDATVQFFLGLVTGLEELAKDELEIDIVRDQIKGRVRTPQVRYVSLAPEDMNNALVSLGQNTIIGIIYKDIVAATLKARETGDEGFLETTKSIAQRRNFNQKSLERSLVQLRQAGLMESKRI